MTNPMYCPMSFNGRTPKLTRSDGLIESDLYWFECTPDCAWAVETERGQYGCCFAQMCASQAYIHVRITLKTTARPLKDDAE